MKVKVLLSHIQFFATHWTVACQAPLSTGFSRQEYCSGLPVPSSRESSQPRDQPSSLMSSELAGGFFTTGISWEAHD